MVRKKTEISIAQKRKICEIKNTSKITLRELSHICEIKINLYLGISTLSEILKNRDKWEYCETIINKSRQPAGKHHQLDNSLVEWISRMDAINNFFTEDIIISS